MARTFTSSPGFILTNRYCLSWIVTPLIGYSLYTGVFKLACSSRFSYFERGNSKKCWWSKYSVKGIQGLRAFFLVLFTFLVPTSSLPFMMEKLWILAWTYNVKMSLDDFITFTCNSVHFSNLFIFIYFYFILFIVDNVVCGRPVSQARRWCKKRSTDKL